MNIAEIDNYLWALEDKRMREEKRANSNWFRGIPLPPAGERQRLNGLMRQIRDKKRKEAEARNAVTPNHRRAAFHGADVPSRSSIRKAKRDQRRLEAARLTDQSFPGTDETTEGTRDWQPNE